MNKKDIYQKPAVNVICLESVEIIATSVPGASKNPSGVGGFSSDAPARFWEVED